MNSSWIQLGVFARKAKTTVRVLLETAALPMLQQIFEKFQHAFACKLRLSLRVSLLQWVVKNYHWQRGK
eukprot:727871-Amphidinium_carterae.1